MAFKYIKEVVTEYSLKDILLYTLHKQPFNKVHHTEKCMQIVCDFIKSHRYEILGTYDGYRVITNGCGELKHIETMGDLGDKKIISPHKIFEKMSKFN